MRLLTRVYGTYSYVHTKEIYIEQLSVTAEIKDQTNSGALDQNIAM